MAPVSSTLRSPHQTAGSRPLATASGEALNSALVGVAGGSLDLAGPAHGDERQRSVPAGTGCATAPGLIPQISRGLVHVHLRGSRSGTCRQGPRGDIRRTRAPESTMAASATSEPGGRRSRGRAPQRLSVQQGPGAGSVRHPGAASRCPSAPPRRPPSRWRRRGPGHVVVLAVWKVRPRRTPHRRHSATQTLRVGHGGASGLCAPHRTYLARAAAITCSRAGRSAWRLSPRRRCTRHLGKVVEGTGRAVVTGEGLGRAWSRLTTLTSVCRRSPRSAGAVSPPADGPARRFPTERLRVHRCPWPRAGAEAPTAPAAT